jgi:phage shock protein PspC (stress-responsive transcriptional regulator)
MSSIWTIRRSTTDAKVSGLCGGVAQHWGVDPLLVRVGCVLLALSGGVGLVLYLAGWLLIPVEGKDKSTVDDMFGETVSRWPRELWIAPAVVIAIIWYFGFYKPRQSKRADSAPPPARPAVGPTPPVPAPFSYPGPPTPFTQAAEAWARRIEENARATTSAWSTPEPAATSAWSTPEPAATTWPSPPPPGTRSTVTEPSSEWRSERADHQTFLATPDPVGLYAEPVPVAPVAAVAANRRTARRLRLVSLIILGLALSGLGVLDSVGVAVPLAAYFATALLVLGLTLVAATWLGRACGLLPLAVLLTVAVLALTAAGPTQTRMPTFADQSRTYLSATALPIKGDAVDVGNLSVDLSQISLAQDAAYRAQVDVGNLVVTVPRDARVVVHYSADWGAVTTFGEEVKGGSDVRGDTADPTTAAAGQPTLTLDLSVDVGHVEVRR